MQVHSMNKNVLHTFNYTYSKVQKSEATIEYASILDLELNIIIFSLP